MRKGPNPNANSAVALRASTGKFVWAFQAVHHDLWDHDVASPPALMHIPREGKVVDAVAVAAKTGHLFFLDRDTGKPIFPVEERPVPASDIPGETANPTQPIPVVTPNLVGNTTVLPEDAWGLTDADREVCKALISSSRSEGPYTPPSFRGSLTLPGTLGGAHWGGFAIDDRSGLLITTVNRFAMITRLIPRAEPYTPYPGELIQDQAGTPYLVGRRMFNNPRSLLPCTKPPWGALVAVDLATGTIRWEVPLGRIRGTEQIPGSESWGSYGLGGPIVTDGGLTFIGAALDNALHAFDTATGKELWTGNLPAGGQATPMTYRSPHGKQFVLITAGGSSNLGQPPGDHLVAFALRPKP